MGSKEQFYVDISTECRNVSGSRHLAVIKLPNGETIKFLTDFGQFLSEEEIYNDELCFKADEIDFILATHVHVDHVGMIPFLVKRGFYGKIYASEDTRVLLPYALEDSNKIMEKNAKRRTKVMLYSNRDTEKTIMNTVGCKFNVPIEPTKNVKAYFFRNLHLVGSAMILVQISYPGYEDINLLFIGDYNNKSIFVEKEELPDWVKELKLIVITESTYGYMNSTEVTKTFENNIIANIENGGAVVVPVSALEKSQDVMYYIQSLQRAKKLSSNVPIYYDGKLGIKYTKLFTNGKLQIKESMRDFLPENLTFVDKKMRRDLLRDTSSKIILTTSGNGSFGSAPVYIQKYIEMKNALIQFTSYTSPSSFGGRLKSVPKGERFLEKGIYRTKWARVEYTTECSKHAKADEIIEFLKKLKNLQMVLVTHGDEDVKEMFAKRVLDEVNTQYVGILNGQYLFRVNQDGLVKTFTTKH